MGSGAFCESRGAWIERGIIAEVREDGYVVASIDRDGIISPPIQPIGENDYAEGDLVCFFLFPDGTGKIICGA